jgi:MtN3 and saliva related transmembrane protein
MEITGVSIIGYVAGTCTTLAFLPQVIRTWTTRSTEDISLGMFSLMVFGIALWLFYGVVTDDWPLIIADGFSLFLAAMILLMKVRFG